MEVLKPCVDAMKGLLQACSGAGDDSLVLGVAESMLSCALGQSCECHKVCSERAVELFQSTTAGRPSGQPVRPS